MHVHQPISGPGVVGHGDESKCEHEPVSFDDARLAERYGARRRPAARRLGQGLLTLVVLVFLGWVAWAGWLQATPEVESELIGYTVRDAHATEATLEVALREGVAPRCLVRAISADHTPVGELSFIPDEGRNRVTIRTERAATSVELVGCTTADQQRPR
jgi:hypothetical protein